MDGDTLILALKGCVNGPATLIDGEPEFRKVPLEILERTIKELEFLRRISGAVSQGKDFADYRREANRPDDAF